jgi:hypothetical protein
MKAAASFFIVIWSILIVQPTFAYFGGKPAYGTCTKADESTLLPAKSQTSGSTCSKKKKVAATDCSKKKCNKPGKSESKNNCNTDGCNPTLGCSAGNFFIHHYSVISITSWFAQKQKVMVLNDNRILKNMSDCWRPPKA